MENNITLMIRNRNRSNSNYNSNNNNINNNKNIIKSYIKNNKKKIFYDLNFFENYEIITMQNMIINNLKIKKCDVFSENKYHINNCIICFEYFNENEEIIKLNCFHIFHSNCIEKWLTKNKFCPICKKDYLYKNTILYEN